MRQTLFYIPTELFGIPLLGNGLLFWGLIIVACCLFAWRFLKNKLTTDDISFGVVLLLIAFASRFFLPQIAKPEGLPIRGYGVMLTLAIGLASALLWYRGRKKWNIPTDMTFSLVIWSVISGILGARLFHVVEYWPIYAADPHPLRAALMYSEGGLVVYGSIIGGMLGVTIFFVKNRLAILAMFDVMAPALLLGIAVGRLGCFLNGCCFGAICENDFCVTFPPASPAHWSQIEQNKVFIGGLKITSNNKFVATPQTNQLSIPPSLSGSLTEKQVPVDERLPQGGCASCQKRSIVDIENDNNQFPAVIAEVEPESHAEKAGLKPGMTIHRMAIRSTTGESQEIINRESGTLGVADVKKTLLDQYMDAPDQPITLMVTDQGETVEQVRTFLVDTPQVLPVYPTQLISFVGALILSALLMWLERFDRRDGFALMLLLFMYSISRFFIEIMRDDEASFWGTELSISQNISILIFVCATILAIYLYTRPPQQALTNRFPLKASPSE